ncbi:hypothetical protein CH63R_13121 [Colletotrichum higginsianum IMI 349063]|uniref:Uncharacterized protein n=2 Tax=Colletotrichum higginsianum TaxID=80884 RepID=A0A1B7XW72_COLHI|nr:hypothetical protein CH63R_13121 [Colletotrichum higginsianum IMI 349063]OBR03994.1 hypothetical protein CH63R_13121 [Colletotrichum higginsianum IMI 349063]TIC90368.1 hypothetical protein CH35J_011993 [Colletotrichum higginsianum]GJD03646.1 hypothetical protein ColKHC_12471 [Colletotrichum higginsianum]
MRFTAIVTALVVIAAGAVAAPAEPIAGKENAISQRDCKNSDNYQTCIETGCPIGAPVQACMLWGANCYIIHCT